MISRLLSLSDVVVVAHRGGSTLRPENTMAAFDHAASLGVDGLECDVHLSRDGEPVVIHDATLDRTTNASGPVAALTANQLGSVDAAYWFGEAEGYPHRGTGQGVPRLEDLLRRHANVPFVIEIKGEQPEAVSNVLHVVRSLDAEQRVLIGGFSDDLLTTVRRLAPDVPTSASRDEVRSALRRALFHLGLRAGAYQLMQVPFRFHGRRVFGRRFVQAVRRAGLPLQAWIVDAEEDMRTLIGWGVTGLISDRPDIAMEVVGRAGSSRRPPDGLD